MHDPDIGCDYGSEILILSRSHQVLCRWMRLMTPQLYSGCEENSGSGYYLTRLQDAA
jgi:hypothetical protein